MELDFSGRHPLTEAIYKLRFDASGGVVKSYRQIAADLSIDEKITASQVSGIMARNRDLFPKEDKEPPRKYSTTKQAVEARAYYQRKKQQETKSKKSDDEVVETGENKLYIDGSSGNNPPRQWRRTRRTEDAKQKDFLLGERLSSDFLTSDKGWQIGRNGIRGKSLVDIGIRECRYVVDDTEGNMLMCGKHAETYPYCSSHNKYSYRASGARRL